MIGICYDAYWHDSVKRRVADVVRLREIGFDWLHSAFGPTPDDDAAARACQDTGMMLSVNVNAMTWAQANTLIFSKYSVAKAAYVQDDAHAVSPEVITQKRDAIKAAVPRAKTMLSIGRTADHAKYANLCDWYAIQLYTYGDEGWFRRGWDLLLSGRAACAGRLVLCPYVGRLGASAQWQLRDSLYMDEDYQPLSYAEAQVWAGLCAGVDDILFYSAYWINPTYPRWYSYFLERRDQVEQMWDIIRYVRSWSDFFTGGRRETFDVGSSFGATWTLPDGRGMRCTITLSPREFYPRVQVVAVPRPSPPPVARVALSGDGVTFEVTKP